MSLSQTLVKHILAVCMAALSGCTPRPQLPGTGAPQCFLSGSDTRWIQGVLDGWTQVTRDFLEVDPDPLPATVLLDESCVWYVAAEIVDSPGSRRVETPLRFEGRDVPVHGVPHDGTVLLPNAVRIPADIIAVAMPYHSGEAAFFVLALPDLWHRHPQASRDPHLSIRIESVALHEMIHTRQLPWLRRIVSAMGTRFELPAQFDDDVVEARFKISAEYTAIFDAERSLLYQAVEEQDLARKRALVSEALSIAQGRQTRFFVRQNEVFAELEGLFLNMEGLAEWVRFRHHQADPAWPSEQADIVAFLRGRENSWSQDEGLALFLLLDDLVPDWKRSIFNPEMPSPLDILRDAVQQRHE